MYSPVLLSWPTTSGSPPVLSISLSDHSLSALASSFAYLLLRCAWPHVAFSGLSLRFCRLAVSKPFGVRQPARPRSPPQGEYECVPSFPSRRESARKSRALPPQTPPAAPA